jgi:hypothetical protein
MLTITRRERHARCRKTTFFKELKKTLATFLSAKGFIPFHQIAKLVPNFAHPNFSLTSQLNRMHFIDILTPIKNGVTYVVVTFLFDYLKNHHVLDQRYAMSAFTKKKKWISSPTTNFYCFFFLQTFNF